jgi:1-acyl-sn-glycerol-3-phosphate acyltransferase
MPPTYPERYPIKLPFYFWITGPPLLLIRLPLILIFLILMTSFLLILGLITKLSGLELKRIRKFLHHLSGRICTVLIAAKIKKSGNPPPEGSLMVSDHRSWADAFIYLNDRPVSFIVTKESSTWPIIGFLVRSLGNIYINREAISDIKSIMEAVEEKMIRGESVIFFPEATTIDGETEKSLPFKSSLFEAAVRLNKPVYCAALEYESCRGWPDASRMVAWGDWTPFLIHVCRVLMMPWFTARVHYLVNPVKSENRKDMAQKAQIEIMQALEKIKNR